jgi:hypothetical protein
MTRFRALVLAGAAAMAYLIPGCFDWGDDPCLNAAPAGAPQPCD